MSATALFPMYFLKSFAYAGVATVAFVATASIVLTPAAIVLLGPRIDTFDVRRLLRRLLQPPEPVQAGRAAVLVPVEQVRDAALAAGRAWRYRVAAAARASVHLGEVGFPGRPGASGFVVVASGR